MERKITFFRRVLTSQAATASFVHADPKILSCVYVHRSTCICNLTFTKENFSKTPIFFLLAFSRCQIAWDLCFERNWTFLRLTVYQVLLFPTSKWNTNFRPELFFFSGFQRLKYMYAQSRRRTLTRITSNELYKRLLTALQAKLASKEGEKNEREKENPSVITRIWLWFKAYIYCVHVWEKEKIKRAKVAKVH